MLKKFLSYSYEAKQSLLTMGLFYKDTAGKMVNLDDENKGLAKRKKYTAQSATVPIIGKYIQTFSSKTSIYLMA